jgi:murein DD-endopeptidase MepM/ murein hydrolase activator NlpD
VRKASVIPAAALAAVFLFGLTSSTEGKSASSSTAKTAASKGSASGRDEVVRKKKHTPAARPKAKAAKAPKKARHAVRPNPGGAVAVERLSAESPEFYGPFLPVEVVDQPVPFCEPLDVVLEAHVHETDEETPEPETIADDMPEGIPSTLARAARNFGAFLRPKSSESTMRPEDVDLSDLMTAGVQIPVEGVDASRLRDSFLNSRGRHRQHLAIDIGAPRGTPVLAAADGEIVRLRREQRGGISLYQKDGSGKFLLFYCHLSRYARGVKPGDQVSKGDVIAYVGSTGHVIGGAHLHFSITRLPEDDDNFKAGVAINPYLLFLASVP